LPNGPEENTNCWVCGGSNISLWKAGHLERPLLPEDFSVTDHAYGSTLALDRCEDCGFIFCSDERVDHLVANYEQLEDVEYERGGENRTLQMRELLKKTMQRAPAARTVLDIGAGIGLMVAEAERLGLEATGVEPSRYFVERAKKTTGVHLLQGIFPHPDLAGRQFDLIFLIDVIEHVSNPVELLRVCGEVLEPGGLILVVTPDLASLAARALGQRWWHFRLAHVGYFTRQSLTLAASKANLEPAGSYRPSWVFPIHYLAHRVGEYLPVRPLNRLAQTLPPLRWVYQRKIRLNLFDSLAFFFQK